ncbi:hypothetical protein LCGC14_1071760 [marine sediment metagenome]|uniref:Uncharacterized protein n=1 Tax=marine sediment metagenome TaxID=412755 RepID=A0A0F9Q153_9ZZZZ
MNKKWKIAIVILFLMFFWIRFAPALVWWVESVERGNRLIERGWCSSYEVVYEWSWWSLRFTNIYPDC